MHEKVLADLRERIGEVQKTKGRSRRYPNALKREVIEAVSAWERNGGDAGTLCSSLRIDSKTVRDWQRQGRVGDNSKGIHAKVDSKAAGIETQNDVALFVPVQVGNQAPRSTGCRLEIVVRGERRIRFEALPDQAVLSELVTCLEAIPC